MTSLQPLFPSGLTPYTVCEWDAANWARALGVWRRYGRTLEGARVLEIGARGGGVSLWCAAHGAAEVVCSDVETAALDKARTRHAAWPELAARCTYEMVNALAIPPEFEERFDIVVFKSVLGGVGAHGHPERQQQALAAMARTLVPGGEIWFAENLTASPLHRMARRWYVSWGRRWRYIPWREWPALMEGAGLAPHHLESLGFLGAFGRSEDMRRTLGRIDAAGFERLLPAAWRYIGAGVARKDAVQFVFRHCERPKGVRQLCV